MYVDRETIKDLAVFVVKFLIIFAVIPCTLDIHNRKPAAKQPIITRKSFIFEPMLSGCRNAIYMLSCNFIQIQECVEKKSNNCKRASILKEDFSIFQARAYMNADLAGRRLCCTGLK